jgi:ribulose-phosphate 3-epimerase
MTIIPTIFDKDYREAERKLGLVSGLTKWVQIDVTDDMFTPGKTFELELLNKFETNGINFLYDIHLMVKDPIKWLEKCLFVNATRVIGQVEMMSSVEAFVEKSKDIGFEAGIAYDWGTEIGKIPKETDEILLMGRKAGFGDFELEKGIFIKIEALKQRRVDDNLDFMIGVDGAVTLGNVAKIKTAGADWVYCGEAVFHGNVNDNLDLLRKEIKSD